MLLAARFTCVSYFAISIPSEVEKETYTVGHDVRVAVQRALGEAVLGLVTGQVPDDEGLVARAGQEHVRARGGKLSAFAVPCHVTLVERASNTAPSFCRPLPSTPAFSVHHKQLRLFPKDSRR